MPDPPHIYALMLIAVLLIRPCLAISKKHLLQPIWVISIWRLFHRALKCPWFCQGSGQTIQKKAMGRCIWETSSWCLCLSVCLLACLSAHLPACPSLICLSLSMSVCVSQTYCLCVFLSVCLSVCLFVRLSVCPSGPTPPTPHAGSATKRLGRGAQGRGSWNINI